MPASRSDEELMAAYVAGDRAAFRELFERHAALLLRFTRRQLPSREEANDLVQQTFLQLHRARLDFDPAQRFKPWFFRIALNLKREHFRRLRRRPEDVLDESHEPAASARPAERLDAQDALDWALDKIPPEQQEVILLHWFEGLSFAEIADCLGVSVPAAKVRAHRGYLRLRKLLDDSAAPDSGNSPPPPAIDRGIRGLR